MMSSVFLSFFYFPTEDSYFKGCEGGYRSKHTRTLNNQSSLMRSLLVIGMDKNGQSTHLLTSCWCCCRFAFAQKKHVAVASLSHRKNMLLSLRFRTEKTCCCRFAFAQKKRVAVASLSHRKNVLLSLR